MTWMAALLTNCRVNKALPCRPLLIFTSLGSKKDQVILLFWRLCA
jgi:hypothetical protein